MKKLILSFVIFICILFMTITSSYASQEFFIIKKAHDNIILGPYVKTKYSDNNITNNVILESVRSIEKDKDVLKDIDDPLYPYPDLTIYDLKAVGRLPFKAEKSAIFKVTLENLGNITTYKEFKINVYINNSLYGCINIEPLDTQDKKELRIKILDMPEGIYSIKLVVDGENIIEEAQEDNNEVNNVFEWKGTPNLKALSINVNSTEPFSVEEDIKFEFGIANDGTGMAKGKHDIKLYINNNEVITWTAENVPAHATGIVPLTLQFKQSGEYEFKFIMDTENVIEEKNEDDNIIIRSFTVQ